MLIKQQLGSQFAIGGQIEEITPLYLSVYNWNGISSEIDLISLSDNFSYFFIKDLDRYLWARAVAFSENWKNYFEETHDFGGVWKKALDKAQKEYNDIPYEEFLPKTGEYYFGSYNRGYFDREDYGYNLVSKKLIKAFDKINN